MGQIRRLVPRQLTDWHGKYMFEEDPERQWRDCQVLDISSAGAGLELFKTTPDQCLGTRIVLALRADLRYTAPGRNDGLRVGVQFVDLTPNERAYRNSLAD